MDSIKAPLLPFWATSLVVFEKRFINETAPEVLFAAFETLAPVGLKLEISTPTPHLLLKSCANC